MKLYEIDNAILECVDYETGEILDSEKLLNLQLERSKKIEGIACYYKNLKAEITALADEEEKLKERKKVKQNIVQNLQNYLTAQLAGEKFETSKVTISWRKSKSVNVLDIDKVPIRYQKTKIERTADKDQIKKDIQETGISVSGVELLENNNIQIK